MLSKWFHAVSIFAQAGLVKLRLTCGSAGTAAASSPYSYIIRLRVTLAWACLALLSPLCHAADRPNIVFILADDLGYTDLGCYGSKYYETPNIDRLAKEGMRFTSGYSCGPNCQPTRAALMTGQYAPRTGVYTVGSEDKVEWQSRALKPVKNIRELPLEKNTIAQALKNAGYATGMFGKWHLGGATAYHPNQRGFDEAISSQGKHFDFKTSPTTPYEKGIYLADFLTDHAIGFIRKHREEPFFLYLPHFCVHRPHEAKSQLIARFKTKPVAGGHRDPVYAAMIASLDESVGRILQTLDDLTLADRTLVIFSSDNGGVGGYQRAGVEMDSITDNAPLRGGKGMLYEGGIRIPYIFRQPGAIRAGTVCDVPIVSVDLFPTLLSIAKAALTTGVCDGLDYSPLLFEKSSDALDARAIFWHFPGYLDGGGQTWRTTPVSVIRQGDWKLLEFLEDGHQELYYLRDDIGEANNLASLQPDRVRDMHARLDEWRRDVDAKMPEPNLQRRPPSAKKKSAKDDE